MATGSGFGGLVTAFVPFIMLAGILVDRRNRKRKKDAPEDDALKLRQDAARDTQRRMAEYLAQRQTSRNETIYIQDEQETMR